MSDRWLKARVNGALGARLGHNACNLLERVWPKNRGEGNRNDVMTFTTGVVLGGERIIDGHWPGGTTEMATGRAGLERKGAWVKSLDRVWS